VSAPNDQTEFVCKKCGDCCRNNGAIPPLLDAYVADATAPEWLRVLVRNMRKFWADTAEEKPHCVFLTDDNLCAIHDIAKPDMCKGFTCETIPLCWKCRDYVAGADNKFGHCRADPEIQTYADAKRRCPLLQETVDA